MPNLTELKAQLSILRKGWQLVPAESDSEIYLRDCEENLVLIQIEAQSLREAIKHEILLAKKVIYTKGDNSYMRTAFGWEAIREATIKEINEREIRGIAYYESEIKKLYGPERQSETGAKQPFPVSAINEAAKV